MSPKIIIPALLEYEGSYICIDHKGENAAVCTAALIRQGVNVLQINPFDILPEALPQNETGYADHASAKDLKNGGWA